MPNFASAPDRPRIELLLRQGKPAEALPILREMAKDFRQDLGFQKTIADVYFLLSDHQNACEHFRLAMLLSKRSDLDVMEKFAFALHNAGQKDKALDQFSAALAAGVGTSRFMEGYRAALRSHLRTLEKAEKFGELVQWLRRQVRTYPDDAVLLAAFAQALIREGNGVEALDVASRAYQKDPLNFTIPFAILLLNAGRPFEVFPLLYRVNDATLDAGVAHVNHALAKSLAADRGEEPVPERLEKLLAASPESQSIILQLALAYLREGDFEGVRAAMTRFNERSRRSHAFSELQARVALVSGNPSAALAILAEIWARVAAAWPAGPVRGSSRARASRTRKVVSLVYMPIEYRQRELEARVLTACFLAEKQISSVIVGMRNFVHSAGDLPPGIILNKTLNSLDRSRVERAGAGGHVFAALDEEAMAWTGEDWEMLCGVDAGIVELIDLILVTGPRHKEAYEAIFPEAQGRISVTGNPRLDLLKRASDAVEVDRLRTRYGDFVLVCTNFASTNSSLFGFADACEIFLKATSATPGSSTFDQIVAMGRSSSESECTYFKLLTEVLPELAAAFPAIKFVVRAHPGESDAVWKTIFKGIPNVIVDSTGPLHPSLLAARAMIYMSGCATGLEAYLANVPAMRLSMDPELKFPKYGLSHNLNTPAKNPREAIGVLRSLLDTGPKAHSAAEEAFVDHHILRSREPAAKKMAAALDSLYAAHAQGGRGLERTIVEKLRSATAKGWASAAREARAEPFTASKKVTFDRHEVQELAALLINIFAIPVQVEVTALTDDAILIAPKAP